MEEKICGTDEFSSGMKRQMHEVTNGTNKDRRS